MKTKCLLLAVLISLCAAVSASATVQRVVVVQTDDVAAYVKELGRGQAMLAEMGSVQKLRVWRPRFAGPNVGILTVSIEYADLAAYAEDEKKVGAHAEFQAWLKRLGTMRKLVSDSLHDELKL